MTLQATGQGRIVLSARSKRDLRTQFAALCFRIKAGKPEILLITSRRTGRWIIPKGWPVDGRTPGESALLEAWEEAGVRGRLINRCLGVFFYEKELEESGDVLPCAAMVYPVKVASLSDEFPEMGQRKRRWMGREKAALRVDEPELARMIREFDPRQIRA